jgi:hypothetical protein
VTEAPRYHRGMSILLCITCVMAFAMFIILYLLGENRKKSARIAAIGIQDEAIGSGASRISRNKGLSWTEGRRGRMRALGTGMSTSSSSLGGGM